MPQCRPRCWGLAGKPAVQRLASHNPSYTAETTLKRTQHRCITCISTAHHVQNVPAASCRKHTLPLLLCYRTGAQLVFEPMQACGWYLTRTWPDVKGTLACWHSALHRGCGNQPLILTTRTAALLRFATAAFCAVNFEPPTSRHALSAQLNLAGKPQYNG